MLSASNCSAPPPSAHCITNGPDAIDASDLHLTPIQPGVVYGTYRYRVRYGAEEHTGLSERVFRKTADGWRIAVTGAVDTPVEWSLNSPGST